MGEMDNTPMPTGTILGKDNLLTLCAVRIACNLILHAKGTPGQAMTSYLK